MLIRFVKWFRGYLLVRITGYSPERFINLCRNRNILIWNLCRVEQGYEFNMSVKGFRQIKEIAKKTGTRPLIVKRYGFPFKEKRMGKHRGFVLGIILFLAMIYGLSLFIWDMTLEGNYSYTEDVIFGYLEEINVKPGVMKSKLDCKVIEESIRKKYTDIGWVSAEITGTKLKLKIVETNMPLPFVQSTTPCNIIASHDGVIRSIVTRNGVPMVKKGDEVKKGDVLVSGIIEVIGDDQTVVKKEAVVSDADIMLETNFSYKKALPVQYKKKVFNKRKIDVYTISIFDKQFYLYNPLKKFHSSKKYDIITSERNFSLTHSFVLPLSVAKKEYREYVEEDASYSKDELTKKSQEYFSLYTEMLKEEGVIIKKSDVKVRMDKKTCVSAGNLLVEEPVHETQKINETEWRITETDEHSGNNS